LSPPWPAFSRHGFPRLSFAPASTSSASGRPPIDCVFSHKPRGQDKFSHHSKDTVCVRVVRYFRFVRAPHYAYLLKSLPTSAAPWLHPRPAGSTLAPALVPAPASATACALGPHSQRALRQASCPSGSVRLQVAHDARTPGGLADLASGTHEVCTSTTRLRAFQFGGVSQSSRLGVTPRPPCSGCPVRRFPNLAVWCNAQVFFTDSDFICRTRRRLWKPWYSRG